MLGRGLEITGSSPRGVSSARELIAWAAVALVRAQLLTAGAGAGFGAREASYSASVFCSLRPACAAGALPAAWRVTPSSRLIFRACCTCSASNSSLLCFEATALPRPVPTPSALALPNQVKKSSLVKLAGVAGVCCVSLGVGCILSQWGV